jgi:hypothetical protein
LDNILVSQLESLLNFLHNVLCHGELDCESFPRHCLITANQSKANPGISSTTGSGGLSHHDTIGSLTGTHEDDTPFAVAPSDDWGDFDINQMLDQQFLDPSWLEDIQV